MNHPKRYPSELSLRRRGPVCRSVYLVSVLLLSVWWSLSHAGTQSLAQIETAVEAFVESRYPDDSSLEISVRGIDSRLRLAACEAPLQAEWAPGSRPIGLSTIRVMCKSSTPWQLHVQAEISREAVIWVMARSADRGTLFSEDLVRQERTMLGRDMSMLRRNGTPIHDIEPWLGHEFRQALSSGQVLNEQSLVARTLVSRGETVRVLHSGAGLRIETRAVALSSGARDQRLQVRNPRSGKVIEAIVTAPGLVSTLH